MKTKSIFSGIALVLVTLLLGGCGYFGNPLSPQNQNGEDEIWIDPTAFTEDPLGPMAAGGTQWVPQFVPGQLIVEFREGKFTDVGIRAFADQYGLQVVGRINKLRLALVRVPPTVDLETMRTRLRGDPNVESVEVNHVYQLLSTQPSTLEPKHITNDPRFSWQWGLFQIGFNRIAATVLPATAPIIAVVDTGVDYNHPDLRGKVILGPDYVDGDMTPMDTTGHGTHVAGIAAALTDNNVGIAGVSGRSRILAVRVGRWWISAFAGAAGIVYSADYPGVRVINLSWGGRWDSVYIRKAVNYAVTRKGVLVVAAAGNWDTADPVYPAAYENVLAVGATDREDRKAFFSNFGDYVDIAAPGENIYSTVPAGGYDWYCGTSMSSPFVAGAAALVWGKWPTMTLAEVRELLCTTGDECYPEVKEWPWYEEGDAFPPWVKRLNLYNAFKAKLGTMPPAGGAIIGIVVDANTGRLLAGATVTATPLEGGTARTTTSRADGSFILVNVPTGGYNLRAARSGYITTPSFEPVWVMEDGHYAWGGVLALPRTQASDVYTVVLTFGECDSDLDSFLWLPPGPKAYMVFSGQRGRMTAHPFAQLLRDEPSESPRVVGEDWPEGWWSHVETVTFRAGYTGTYLFAVRDYGGGNRWNCTYPVVRIYRGNALVGEFRVPGESSGEWWTGFTLTLPGHVLNVINEVMDEFPGPYGEELLY